MDWKTKVERTLGEGIKSASPITGGTTFRLMADSGKSYFAKTHPATASQFRSEAAGLEALAATASIRVPLVVVADERLLLLEWIESETPDRDFWRRFGRELAQLHQRKTDHYGFTTENHLGATPQTNPRRSAREISWTEYFIEYRLQPLLHSNELVADSLLQATYAKHVSAIRKQLDRVKESPCLVHGDLWKGNFLCGPAQTPYLIDPAAYWGHREVDLAMSELFGGFAPEFYQSYQQTYPVGEGYDSRKIVYNLYHLLNHWILFGESYRAQTLRAFASL